MGVNCLIPITPFNLPITLSRVIASGRWGHVNTWHPIFLCIFCPIVKEQWLHHVFPSLSWWTPSNPCFHFIHSAYHNICNKQLHMLQQLLVIDLHTPSVIYEQLAKVDKFMPKNVEKHPMKLNQTFIEYLSMTRFILQMYHINDCFQGWSQWGRTHLELI